jgi:hypothetical protein
VWQDLQILALGLFLFFIGIANLVWPAARWVRETGPLPKSALGIKLRTGLHVFVGVLLTVFGGFCLLVFAAGFIK